MIDGRSKGLLEELLEGSWRWFTARVWCRIAWAMEAWRRKAFCWRGCVVEALDDEAT